MVRFILIVAAVITALLFPFGCATVTKSSTQSISIKTRPPGAKCALEREGVVIATINPTPGTAFVEKDNEPISVVCSKQDFLVSSGTLASEFDNMTLGNIIFGGLIGVVVDGASGAMHGYSAMVTISLIPSEFPSIEERDDFFDNLRAEFLQESAMASYRISQKCQDSNCGRKIEAAEVAKQKKLEEIEVLRQDAKISEK